jgi:hypothetical protein
MLKSTCAVLAFTAMSFANIGLMGPALGQDVENEAESKECTAKIVACAGAVTGGVSAVVSTCKELRQCKKAARVEGRDCKKEARGEKKDCKDECRDKFGTGKDYRQCAAECRDDKKDAKHECKDEKSAQKDVCRASFKTPECKAARLAVATLGVPACAPMIACIAASEKEGE